MSFENDKLYQLDGIKYLKQSKLAPPEPPKPVINREEFLNKVYKEFKESQSTPSNPYLFRVGESSLLETVDTLTGAKTHYNPVSWGYMHRRYRFDSGSAPAEPWPYPGISPFPGSIPSDLTYGKAKTWIEHRDLSFTYEEAKPDNPTQAIVLKNGTAYTESINVNDPDFYNKYDLTPFLKLYADDLGRGFFNISLVTLWIRRPDIGMPESTPIINDELNTYMLDMNLTSVIDKLSNIDVKVIGTVATGVMYRFNRRANARAPLEKEQINKFDYHLFNRTPHDIINQYAKETYINDDAPQNYPFVRGASQYGLNIDFFIKATNNVNGMSIFEDEFRIRLNKMYVVDFFDRNEEMYQDIFNGRQLTYIPIMFTNPYGSGKHHNQSMLYFFTDWNATYKFEPGRKAENKKIIGDMFDVIANEKGIDTI